MASFGHLILGQSTRSRFIRAELVQATRRDSRRMQKAPSPRRRSQHTTHRLPLSPQVDRRRAVADGRPRVISTLFHHHPPYRRIPKGAAVWRRGDARGRRSPSTKLPRQAFATWLSPHSYPWGSNTSSSSPPASRVRSFVKRLRRKYQACAGWRPKTHTNRHTRQKQATYFTGRRSHKCAAGASRVPLM